MDTKIDDICYYRPCQIQKLIKLPDLLYNDDIKQSNSMIQQRSHASPHPQNQSQILIPSNPVSPQLFLFQQIVIDILNYCKRNLKVQPFDDMQIDKLVQSNKTQSIDIYQQFFIIGLGNPKTREFVCNKYQQLIRDNLINKDNLPPQMITGIINARSISPGGGGSTASSGSNSIVGSALNINIQKSINIGKLVSTIICNTIQPSSQISAGLVYLLEGTRNKSNSNAFTQLMQDTYSSLNKFRKRPMDRFVSCFLNRIVSEVQYHEAPFIQYEKKYLGEKKKSKQKQASYMKAPLIMVQQIQNQPKYSDPPMKYQYIRKQVPDNPKQRLCVHQGDEDSKFGKCFICDRGAKNYDKLLFVPLCSIQCKNKLKRINQQCLMDDHFVYFKWIIQMLKTSSTTSSSDQILFSLLLREVCESQKLTPQQIGVIMEIIINNFSLQAIGITSIQTQQGNIGLASNKIIENSAIIISHLTRKYPQLMLTQNQERNQNTMNQPEVPMPVQQLINPTIRPNFQNTKVIIIQMMRMLQILPITNNSIQLTLLRSLMEILSSKYYNSASKSYSHIFMKQLYLKCDCKILQINVIERIFNIATQYALQNISNANSSSSVASSSQNLGTNTSLSIENINNPNQTMINNLSLSGANCRETAIIGLQQLLGSLVQTMQYFNILQNQQIGDVILEKKVKKYIETKFVEQFNRKPVKAVEKLRKLFNNKITGKQVAVILRQYMDYDTKVKKIRQNINKQQVGTFFGTVKKDKNDNKQDFTQVVYWEFLKLQQHQYEGRQIDDCLRITFNSFMMPKQGQQVQVVLGPLSLILQPYLGLKHGNQATATYQLIMVSLMVQTSNNPNVKQNQKLKFEGFKKFCSEIDQNLNQLRMTQIYNRIKKRPLEVLMQYKGSQVFTKKYIKPQNLRTQFWKYLQDMTVIQDKIQASVKQQTKNASTILNPVDQKINKSEQASNQQKKLNQQKVSQKQQKKQRQVEKQQPSTIVNESTEAQSKQKVQQVIQSKKSLNLQQSTVFQGSQVKKKQYSFMSFAMVNLWQYIYMSLVNKNNLRGFEQACILFGFCELFTQFQAFFKNLYKIKQELQQKSSSTLQAISNQAKLIILKLAIDYSNYVIGAQSWFIIIKIIYKLDSEQNQSTKKSSSRKPENSYSYYQYETSDKLFTRSNTFQSERLKQFLEAMCLFSSSQARTDKNYTRQMYILHHITEIIEYNLSRFESKNNKQGEASLWNALWPIIRSYFRNICIHPKKQISMSAIDSYKQLTMKMLKLNAEDGKQINHTQLMNLYLYVFERSSSYIKDLVINILLNVICKQMNSGWNQLYTILQISDSEDKTVVMKVVSRLIKDIGLDRIGNLHRFHHIILKQLRIATYDMYAQIINKLFEVCQHFNRLDIWLQTLSKVKDIYKSSTHVTILSFFYRICNQCIKMGNQCGSQSNPQTKITIDKKMVSRQEQSKQMDVEEQMSKLKDLEEVCKQQQRLERIQMQIQQRFMQQSEDQISQLEQNEEGRLTTNQNSKQKRSVEAILKPDQVFRLVYFQVFSVQMHILQIKNNKLFVDTLAIFKQLNLDIFFRNLGTNRKSSFDNSVNSQNNQDSKTGFLTLWEMFLSSNLSVSFSYFLNDYFSFVFKQINRVQKILSTQSLSQKSVQTPTFQKLKYRSIKSMQHLQQIKRQILLWLIRVFMQTSKDQVLQLCQQDSDLSKSFMEILQKQVIPSGRTQLIQFYSSSKQYQSKSIQHLVLLKIFKTAYENEIIKSSDDSKDYKLLADLNKKILQNVIDSYSTASQINNKPILRNFLWNNDFFKAQDYLPGLMKQQIRSFQLIVKYFSIHEMKGKIFKIILDFILRFIEKSKLISAKYGNNKKSMKQASKKQQPTIKIMKPQQMHNEATSRVIQILYQDLGLWITNCQQVMSLSLRKLSRQIKLEHNRSQISQQNKSESKQSLNINKKELFDLCVQLSRFAVSKQVLRQCSKLMEELVYSIY